MPPAILPVATGTPVLTAAALAELSPLRMMANRIARNREVAGVHYPSDSRTGKKLADGSSAIMSNLGTVTELVNAAKLEWAPLT